jgi:hypothetical protein
MMRSWCPLLDGQLALFLVERSASGTGYGTQDGSRAAELTDQRPPL